jgi:hypothetical protein
MSQEGGEIARVYRKGLEWIDCVLSERGDRLQPSSGTGYSCFGRALFYHASFAISVMIMYEASATFFYTWLPLLCCMSNGVRSCNLSLLGPVLRRAINECKRHGKCHPSKTTASSIIDMHILVLEERWLDCRVVWSVSKFFINRRLGIPERREIDSTSLSHRVSCVLPRLTPRRCGNGFCTTCISKATDLLCDGHFHIESCPPPGGENWQQSHDINSLASNCIRKVFRSCSWAVTSLLYLHCNV